MTFRLKHLPIFSIGAFTLWIGITSFTAVSGSKPPPSTSGKATLQQEVTQLQNDLRKQQEINLQAAREVVKLRSEIDRLQQANPGSDSFHGFFDEPENPSIISPEQEERIEFIKDRTSEV